MTTRRLIEDFLPLAELSAEAKREKAIRHGHISTLHVWWARRPLVVARAAVFGALVPAPQDDAERERMRRLIVNLCKWETHDGNPEGRYLLNQARRLIREAHPNGPPRVLDSFAGGGSIPLEALRLGCEAYAVEYNPVAYLILKATLEYPQRYGPRLAKDIRRWGEWVLKQARRELAEFYPPVNGQTPIAYIWSRTIRCPNPSCGAEIPLFRQFWLARKPNKKVALRPVVDKERKWVEFEILRGEELEAAMQEGFDPAQGTVRRANAVCPLCGATAGGDYLRKEAEAYRMGHRLVVVVTTGGKGRNYVIADEIQHKTFKKAALQLHRLKQMQSPWSNGLSLLPDEPVQTKNHAVDRLPMYGMPKWGDPFNPRQALALVTFGKWVREAYRRILTETEDAEYARAVVTYLGFGVDFLANYNSVLTSWAPPGEFLRSIFAGHHLHMIWDYAEVNPFSETTGGWKAGIRWVEVVIKREASRDSSTKSISFLGSAVTLPNLSSPYESKLLDAVIVDPPYYDNVPYADLSDFFYVWLKRTLGDFYPEAFRWQLTPKDEEIVHNPARWGGGKKGEEISRRHFERLLTRAFREIHRVLKPEGIAVVMFTHKSTTAWERLIESLMAAGLYPTASWPIHTEFAGSTHTHGKGSVRSTILLACRKRVEEKTGWYHEIRNELEARVRERLEDFWEAGVRGADFFIAAIGPAIEVFGRYAKVLHPSGEPVPITKLLDEIRTLVADFALERLVALAGGWEEGEGLGPVDAPTRFYLLLRWAYNGLPVLFDEANKLSKATGVELEPMVRAGLLRRKGDKVWALRAFERDEKALEKRGDSVPLITAVHKALHLWRKSELDALAEYLTLEGYIENDAFWRVAQAMLNILGEWVKDGDDPEKTALEQLLGSQESLKRRGTRQLRLF